MLRPGFIPAFVLCAFAAAQQPSAPPGADLVTVGCSFVSHDGAPVRNLTRAEIALADNGQARQIGNLWSESDLPLTLALIADVSEDQAETFARHREAVTDFLSHSLGPRDRGKLIQLGRQAWLLSDFTGGNPKAVEAAVEKIGTHQGKQTNVVGPTCRNRRAPHSCGPTALWHSLYYTAVALKPLTGRKAVVILSEGVDTGSDVTLEDAVEAAQTAGVAVYAVKYSEPTRLATVKSSVIEKFSKGLDRLAHESGGFTLAGSERKDAEDFSRIESALRGTWVVGFTPPPDARNGRFHKLEVKTPRSNLLVRCPAGYWAQTGG